MPTAKPKAADLVEADADAVDDTPHLPSDFVHMRHPLIAGPAAGPVTYEAFDVMWQHKGWVLANDDEVQAEVDARIRGEVAAQSLSAEDIDRIGDQQTLENLAIVWEVDPTAFYEFEGDKANGRFTGNVDLDGLRAALKSKVSGDTK